MADLASIRPRVVVHTPLGDGVIDPFAPGDSPWPDALRAAGITYEVSWVEPVIPASQQLSTGLLSTGAVIGLAVGALLLLRRR